MWYQHAIHLRDHTLHFRGTILVDTRFRIIPIISEGWLIWFPALGIQFPALALLNSGHRVSVSRVWVLDVIACGFRIQDSRGLVVGTQYHGTSTRCLAKTLTLLPLKNHTGTWTLLPCSHIRSHTPYIIMWFWWALMWHFLGIFFALSWLQNVGHWTSRCGGSVSPLSKEGVGNVGGRRKKTPCVHVYMCPIIT